MHHIPSERNSLRNTLRRWLGFGVPALALIAGMVSGAASTSATHTQYTTTEAVLWASTEVNDKDGYNGYKVYLSSPTHTDSGSRGELGWDENLNGRHWNMIAADTEFRDGAATTNRYRNMRARGYSMRVSENSKNGNFIQHRTDANNWGADIYIVTHTNAGGGDYFLVMVDDASNTADDRALRTQMATRLGNSVPGSGPVEAEDNSPYTGGINLGELSSSNAADYVVYNEVIFHDNQTHVDWFGSGGDWDEPTFNAWRYGWAVDFMLGYP